MEDASAQVGRMTIRSRVVLYTLDEAAQLDALEQPLAVIAAVGDSERPAAATPDDVIWDMR